jgi:hypothetical protein
MPRKPLRSQLNQVRAWVRQGRTDAWIAHQLDVPASELREFRRRHGLEADGEEDSGEIDLRDEIEAEIEAATLEEAEAEEAEADEESDDDASDEVADEEGDEGEAPKPRRRRRRRGGRGRGGKRPGAGLQASFDHCEADGYGLWLDPAVTKDPIYTEHWTERRRVEVTIEPDRIVIVPVEDESAD